MSTDEILQRTNGGYDIYEHYYNSSPYTKGHEFKLYKRIFSPFREEKDPSFAVHPHETRGKSELWYKDFGDPDRDATGNAFTFVGYLYGFPMDKHGFPKIIAKIEQEIFGVYNGRYEEGSFVSKAPVNLKKESKEVIIDAYPYKRPWNKSDLEYFARFMITQPGVTIRQAREVAEYWLDKYIMFPVTRYFIQIGTFRRMVQATPTDPIYCIYFPKTGHSKMYRPLTKDKNDKWRSNIRQEVDIFGAHLLPDTAQKLFITAGNKDTLAMAAWTGLPCVPLNSETALLDSIYPLISNVTTNMYSLMNNDWNRIDKLGRLNNTGLKAEKNLLNKWGVKPANQFLKDSQINDVADFINISREQQAYQRLEEAKEYLFHLK